MTCDSQLRKVQISDTCNWQTRDCALIKWQNGAREPMKMKNFVYTYGIDRLSLKSGIFFLIGLLGVMVISMTAKNIEPLVSTVPFALIRIKCYSILRALI